MVTMFWPPPFRTEIPVQVQRSPDGDQFSIDIPFDGQLGPEGLYSVGIWGSRGNSKEHVLISLRTIASLKQGHRKKVSKDDN
jgi:hypothetical protein